MHTQQRQIYFPILDAFRFIAFLRVFMLHISVAEGNSFFSNLAAGGEIGVDFFFVLSGFLITYLLLKENNLAGKVDGKKYMLRRILRIWPLYFLGVAIAYAGNYFSTATGTDSGTGYTPHLLYSVTFVENYRMIFLDTYPSGAPLRAFWSLCVEEHFYILWLLLFTLVKPKYILKALLSLWITGIIYRILFYKFFPGKEVFDTDILSKMDYFCSGGMAGYVLCNYYEESKSILKKIPRNFKKYFMILISAAFFLYQFLFHITRIGAILFPVPSAILFAVLIFLAASSERTGKAGHLNKILAKMGRISYGLYVYHTIVITILMKTASHYVIPFTSNKIIFTIFGLLCFIITFGISFISYRYFESYFLKLKPRVLHNYAN
jgi:peptidoglycan/LPS O-acetylase OafA/YrhL